MMKATSLENRFFKKDSAIHRTGLFSCIIMKKYDFISLYEGEVIDTMEANRREKVSKEYNYIYTVFLFITF